MNISNVCITSRNNDTVKWAASLTERKNRQKYKRFILEGEKLFVEAVNSNLPVTHVFINKNKKEYFLNTVIETMAEKDTYCDTEVIIVSEGVFNKISTEKSPQGIISILKYLDFFRETDIIYKEEFEFFKEKRTLLLTSIQDPGNFGAIIRSAVAFGVEHIIVTDDTADIYNTKTIRSAMGNLFYVTVTRVRDIVPSVKNIISFGRRFFAAELSNDAVSLKNVNLQSDDIIVIGNEGHGIPAEISSLCTNSVYIPISAKTESLNAAVAAAIFMWEQGK